MSYMKRTIIICALILSFVVLISPDCIVFGEGGELPTISAQSAVVIEQNSGRVLYNNNADQVLPMASTTKIMTGLIAVTYGNLDDVVEVSENASGVEGSSMYLEKGEHITLENLVYGLMLLSGNDAAVAIAECVGGSIERFVEMMNETATDMGLVDTHFDNPNGLPSDTHYTTALELAKITSEAMKNPKFFEIVSTKTKTVPWEGRDYDRIMTNHNKLLGSLDGCVGVKTGYTKKAGRCLVSAVQRDEMTLICVTLNDPNDWLDHQNLHNSLFESYIQSVLVSDDMILDKVSVMNGLFGYSGVSSDKTYVFPTSASDDYDVETKINDNLKFPIKAGDAVGTGKVIVNGEEYGNFNLVANNDIDLFKPQKGKFWGGIGENLKYMFSYWISFLNG